MLLHRREAMAWCECDPFSILQPISSLLAETRTESGDCTLQEMVEKMFFCALVSCSALAQ